MTHTKKFTTLTKTDTHIAGGKGASLGEMLNANIPVPDGYVVTADTFDYFLKETDLIQEIDAILNTVDTKAIHTVEHASEKIQAMIKSVDMPQDIATEVLSQFKDLNAEYVAVRSSATAEDGADHAWAGQLDSYLNTTEENLLEMVQSCWASLFTPRAIFYRFEKGLHTTHISVAVVVQKMVNSEISGIAFSVHPVTEDYNQIIIEAGLGLGEAIVSGSVTPDSYVVSKVPREIIDTNVNTQNKALYRGTTKTEHGFNEWKDLSETEANQQVLTPKQTLELSNIIITIENHYGFPCDIEWAFEGGTFYIVQSRPITTLRPSKKKEEFFDKQISLTEWLGNMNHKDSLKHRDEDNEKRERLAVLNEIIGIPFDRPVKFQLTDVVNRSDEFQKYLKDHGGDKCALRLIPLDNEFKKLRMRGKTVREVTEGWLTEQEIDPSKYRADYVPHADETTWSTIFIVNETGIRGEIIADTHEKLTQGYHNENKPISFEYDFKNWKLVPENKKAKKHLETLMNYLNVQEDNQVKIKEQLNGSFTQNYLNGYFETVDTDQGFWFIDYNRLINHQIPDLKGGKTKSDISGQCASVGTYAGNVSIIDDPTDAKFNDGDVLVCDMTSPKYLPLMQKAGAIITRRGGVTCHAAIVARELGVPCIIGIGNAIEILKNGQQVEIDANNGIVKIIESKKANKNEDYVFAFGAHKIAFNQMEAEMKYFVENKFSFFSINNGFLYFEGDVMDAYFSHKDTYINLPDFGTKYLDKKYFNGYLTSLNKAVVSSKDWYQEMWVCNKADLTPDLLIDRYQELYDHLGLLFGFLNSTGKEVLCGIEKQLRTLLEEKYHDNLEEVFALLTTPDVMDEIKEEEISWKKLLLKTKSKPTRNDLLEHAFQYCWLVPDELSEEKVILFFNDRLDQLDNEGIDLQIKEILKKHNLFLEEKLKLLSNCNEEVKHLSHVLSTLTQARMKVKFFYGINFVSRKLIHKIAEYISEDPANIIYHYSQKDVCNSISLRQSLALEELEKRKSHKVLLIKEGKLFCYFGEKALQKVGLLVPKKQSIEKDILYGAIANTGYSKGVVKIIPMSDLDSLKQSNISFNQGDILVTTMTQPNMVSIAKKAGAIVTDQGGITCHAAIISREFSIPCVIGVGDATKVLRDGDIVEVDANKGLVTILERVNSLKIITKKIGRIEEYQKLFRLKGVRTLINDIYARVYNDYEFFLIIKDGDYCSFMTQAGLDRCAIEGANIVSTKEKFDEYIDSINQLIESIKKDNTEILSQDLNKKTIKKFFDNILAILSGYKYTDANFSDGAYQLGEKTKDKNIINRIGELGVFKNKVRDFLNYYLITTDSSLNLLLRKITDRFNINDIQLQDYLQSEILALFDNEKALSEKVISQRREAVLLASRDNELIYADGKEISDLFIKLFKKENEINSSGEIRGNIASPGIVSGYARVISADYDNFDKLHQLFEDMKEGEILVSETTSPDLIPACNKAKGIITNQGGMVSHAAIISREMNIPCIVGTKNATQVIKTGDFVELDAERGIVTIKQK